VKEDIKPVDAERVSKQKVSLEQLPEALLSADGPKMLSSAYFLMAYFYMKMSVPLLNGKY